LSKLSHRLSLLALFGVSTVLLLSTPLSYAQNESDEQLQPYIEKLKKKHNIKSPPREESLPPAPEQKPAATGEESIQPYLDKLQKQTVDSKQVIDTPTPEPRGESTEVQPYIESLKQGKELKPRIKESVRSVIGIGIVASSKFRIRSDKVQANNFDSVYEPNNKYSPSVDLFYEYHLIRNRYFGGLGLLGRVNAVSIKGKGVFSSTGVQTTDTRFRLTAVPVTLGVGYHATQLKYIMPFVQAGLVGIPLLETRDDQKPSRRSLSRGYSATIGSAFNLDWIARRDAWNQYDNHGILHTSLMVEWHFLRTISGPVDFNYDGLFIGLMFEF
jgi:hypothetical protein